MNRENLFRLALVTHTHAPETLNKYIALLAKLVIMESKESSFTENRILRLIKQRFDLEFLDEETGHALNLDGDFEYDAQNKKYTLKPEGIQRLKDSFQNTKPLEIYLNEFIELFFRDRSGTQKTRIRDTIMQYIYYAFNSGKKSLTSLLTGSTEERITEDFNASDGDKKIINQFLDWDNPQKNECIYNIVSYCLDYGMLTAKKDIESYKEIFQGVHFYLDTNIIFRLIGLNNLERQEVIQHFVNKCNEVGIKLCYTNFTYQEIFFALNNIVRLIIHLNNGDKPIAPEVLDKLGDYDEKDFYIIYYNWCKEGKNQYNDYEAYHDFLKQKIVSCLEGFSLVEINNAEHTGNKKEFLELSKGLMDYKNERNHQRMCKIESAKIDVNNFLFVKYAETTEVSSGIKSYCISADRKFYNWAITVLPGVPLVFMPSEWLSIILKYTSRTDSDYNTFCKFMNLRLSQDIKQKQRAMQFIQSINELTSDVDVKRKIINQITESTLTIPDEDFEGESVIVQRAFDRVLEEQRQESSQEMQRIINEKEDEFRKKIDEFSIKKEEAVINARMNGSEDTSHAIARSIADKKIGRWVWIKENIVAADILVGIVSVIILSLISKIDFIEDTVSTFCNSSKLLKDSTYDFSLAISVALAIIFGIIVHIFVNYMSSDKRKLTIIESQIEKHKKMIGKN